MANNSTLRRVFAEVQTMLNSTQYRWVSTDTDPEDYFDWGLSYNTTADSIVQEMLAQGDLEALK